eukprot:Rhum_TRINITY_DN14342_c13_g1::Rhum_TRINITY_DN14342_c13_g1_i1::g.81215::m.81215
MRRVGAVGARVQLERRRRQPEPAPVQRSRRAVQVQQRSLCRCVHRVEGQTLVEGEGRRRVLLAALPCKHADGAEQPHGRLRVRHERGRPHPVQHAQARVDRRHVQRAEREAQRAVRRRVQVRRRRVRRQRPARRRHRRHAAGDPPDGKQACPHARCQQADRGHVAELPHLLHPSLLGQRLLTGPYQGGDGRRAAVLASFACGRVETALDDGIQGAVDAAPDGARDVRQRLRRQTRLDAHVRRAAQGGDEVNVGRAAQACGGVRGGRRHGRERVGHQRRLRELQKSLHAAGLDVAGGAQVDEGSQTQDGFEHLVLLQRGVPVQTPAVDAARRPVLLLVRLVRGRRLLPPGTLHVLLLPTLLVLLVVGVVLCLTLAAVLACILLNGGYSIPKERETATTLHRCLVDTLNLPAGCIPQ